MYLGLADALTSWYNLSITMVEGLEAQNEKVCLPDGDDTCFSTV